MVEDKNMTEKVRETDVIAENQRNTMKTMNLPKTDIEVEVDYYVEPYEAKTWDHPESGGYAVVEDVFIGEDSIIDALNKEVIAEMEETLAVEDAEEAEDERCSAADFEGDCKREEG